ncbi:MAG: hypothetical protein IJ927_04115 [Eubacterium sp.]|nr:hypothetical protein [Eubacterium sp.]
MKKIISIVLSLVMLVSASALTINAFAEVQSPSSVTPGSKITVEVNGNTSKDVTYKADPDDPAIITFTYTGTGTLEGWEFNGMVEGVDYQVVSKDGNSITIELLNGYNSDIDANALVDKDSEGTKGNGKGKSPKTGAAAATGLAAAGAGAAILLALKKREDAE